MYSKCPILKLGFAGYTLLFLFLLKHELWLFDAPVNDSSKFYTGKPAFLHVIFLIKLHLVEIAFTLEEKYCLIGVINLTHNLPKTFDLFS